MTGGRPRRYLGEAHSRAFQKRHMNTTFNTALENWNRYLNDNPDMNIPAMCRAGGPPMNCVYHDVATGHVFISENGGPLKKANPFVVSMATGKRYRGPEKINPLPSKSAFTKIDKRLKHNAIVEDMLDFIFEETYYLHDYFVHSSYYGVRNWYIEQLYTDKAREVLSDAETNCERWDCIIQHITDRIDEIVLRSDEAE